jgi:hypothetical protein
VTQARIKLLFDENIPAPIVSEIERLLEGAQDEEKAEVKHLLAFQREIGLEPMGVWDDVWVPRIVDGGWTVIAADRGMKGGLKKGPRLPFLCVRFGIVHFLLSRRVHARKSFRKLLTILSVWHELLELAASSKPGTRYVIEPAGPESHAVARGKIVKRETPDILPPAPGMLF